MGPSPPRHWDRILQIAALHLSAAEVDSLLLAAGQPSLTTPIITRTETKR